MKEQEIEELLWRALETKVGIEIQSSDLEALKRKLYSTRAKAREKGNKAFDCLQFITPPLGSETKIWLVKGENNGTEGVGGVREDTSGSLVQG